MTVIIFKTILRSRTLDGVTTVEMNALDELRTGRSRYNHGKDSVAPLNSEQIHMFIIELTSAREGRVRLKCTHSYAKIYKMATMS